VRVEALDDADQARIAVGYEFAVETGEERDRIEVFARANGLDIPAAPVVWVVESLLAGGLARGGLLALEDVVPAAAAIGWLRAAGYEVREGGAARV
jgi:hypothetical protein